jgi:hypothetical protein
MLSLCFDLLDRGLDPQTVETKVGRRDGTEDEEIPDPVAPIPSQADAATGQ